MTDFGPTASLESLQGRAAIYRRIREFFDQREFLEVTTPVLSRDTVVDRHLDPFRVTVFSDPKSPEVGPTWYLQTSPEFHMKRLVAAGARAIYQMGPAFRAAEVGKNHNIEFTMLEWYRVGDDMQAGIDLLAQFIETLAKCGPTERISYGDLFERDLGIDPFTAKLDQLQAMSETFSANPERDDCLEWLFADQISPQLGHTNPVIVYDFPESQAALSEIRSGRVNCAERFELFYGGQELANGYHELRSADELRRRIRVENVHRRKDGKPVLPEESRLLLAMESGLPQCSGVAVGVDRLVLALLGVGSLRDVASFGFDRA